MPISGAQRHSVTCTHATHRQRLWCCRQGGAGTLPQDGEHAEFELCRQQYLQEAAGYRCRYTLAVHPPWAKRVSWPWPALCRRTKLVCRSAAGQTWQAPAHRPHSHAAGDAAARSRCCRLCRNAAVDYMAAKALVCRRALVQHHRWASFKALAPPVPMPTDTPPRTCDEPPKCCRSCNMRLQIPQLQRRTSRSAAFTHYQQAGRVCRRRCGGAARGVASRKPTTGL